VFWVTAGNTLYFAVTQVALGTVVALLVALLLSQAMPGNGVMRTIVYLPQAMSYVVVALIWNLLYDPLNGPINGLLEALSFGPVNFLTDSHLAMPSIIAMSIWRNLGYFMIILLAGIQSVSTEMLEAAQMDGAGAMQRFFHITVPQLSNTLLFVVVTWFLGGLQMFTQSYVMTDGGPVNATRTLVFQMYDAAFKAGSIGEATAISVMMFSAVVVVSILLRAAQSLRTTRMEEACAPMSISRQERGPRPRSSGAHGPRGPSAGGGSIRLSASWSAPCTSCRWRSCCWSPSPRTACPPTARSPARSLRGTMCGRSPRPTSCCTSATRC